MSSALPPEILRHIIALAARAPSSHNTQPWRWRETAAGLELHEDRTRRLPAADPSGRSLVISCGAALHHLQVAAGALGWETEVDRVPRQRGLDPARTGRAAPRPAVRARRGRSQGHRRALHRSPSVHVLAGARRTARPAGRASRPRTGPRLSRSCRSPRGSGPSCSWAGRRESVRRPGHRARAAGVAGSQRPRRHSLPCSPARPRRCAGASSPLRDRRPGGSRTPDRGVGRAHRPGQRVRRRRRLAERGRGPERALARGHDPGTLRGPAQPGRRGGRDPAGPAARRPGRPAHPLLLVRIGWQEIGRSELPRTSRRPVADVLDRSARAASEDPEGPGPNGLSRGCAPRRRSRHASAQHADRRRKANRRCSAVDGLASADVLLADGSIAVVRPLRPDDGPALHELHDSVSDEAIRLRFFTRGPARRPHLRRARARRRRHARAGRRAPRHDGRPGHGRADGPAPLPRSPSWSPTTRGGWASAPCSSSTWRRWHSRAASPSSRPTCSPRTTPCSPSSPTPASR